jgi:hypothetical protein
MLGKNSWCKLGKLPSDDLMHRIARAYAIGPLRKLVPERLIIPGPFRDAFRDTFATFALPSAGVLPYMNQMVGTLQQIPLLIEEVSCTFPYMIHTPRGGFGHPLTRARFSRFSNVWAFQVAGGARDFYPLPKTVQEEARRSYRAPRTLILQYDNDSLDESEKIEHLLREEKQIDVQRTTLSGGHTTPLFAPPLDLAIRAEDILGNEAAKERLLYKEADATVDELVRWLEEGNL